MNVLLIGVLMAAAVAAEKKPASLSAPPVDEELNYSINWPTGLSLGEARLRTLRVKTEASERWETEFTLDASIPGFAILEKSRSSSDPEFCSAEMEKSYTHGKRKAEEKTTFDQHAKTATRETKGGGKSDVSLQNCAKDALAYLDYVRHELSQGHLPPQQTVYFGAPYRISLQFGGTQQLKIGDSKVEADRLLATLKGEKTDISFELFFSKDAARTPLLVKVPLQLATFSMELIR
jgi:hypothetical protein